MESYKSRFLWKDLAPKYPLLSLVNKGKKLPEFYSKYSQIDFSNVYEPAEDSFLMVDTLEEECKSGGFDLSSSVSCEIGCGSSFVSISLIQKLLELGVLDHKHACFDINNDCISLSTRIVNDLHLEDTISCLEANFFDSKFVLQALNQAKQIILIFNPPYVTTEADELDLAKINKDIYASWAGGDEGNQVILEFAKYINSFINEEISKEGKSSIILYLLLSCENNIDKCLNAFEYLECSCLSTILAKNERLGIFKLILK